MKQKAMASVQNKGRRGFCGRFTKRPLGAQKVFSDPILISMITVLLIFLALFILYPLLMLLVDSFYTEGTVTLSVFQRVLNMERFQGAFRNTLVLGFITGIASTAIGLLFAYVEVYVKLRTKVMEKLFGLVSMLPVVSPAFRSLFVHDHAFWTERFNQPVSAAYI